MLLTATVVGLTLTVKLLIALGIGGSALLGGAAGALLHAFFGGNDNPERQAIEENYQHRRERREESLDKVVTNTQHHTNNLRQRTQAHTAQMQQATEGLVGGSLLWRQEGQQLQDLVVQLRTVIGEREQQLQQLQTQISGLPTVSKGLTQSQRLLVERQNDLMVMMTLLRPILQQLEARHQDWSMMTRQLQTLESTQTANKDTLAKAGQRHRVLVGEVKRLQSQLSEAMGTIQQLEAAKEAYKDKLESIGTTSQQVQGVSSQSSNNPRFF